MSGTTGSIRGSAARRGITRLCHFTPSRNLGHIAADLQGILASRHLGDDEKAIFNPTDLERLDGYPDHVCCSIQYPNAWYFKKARGQERLFRDWVVLLIDPLYLWRTGTKFSPRNAAAMHGRLVGEGVHAFEALFEETVQGAGGRTFKRGPSHPPFLPTDEQAEVLIPDRIQRQDVMGMAVYNELQARQEVSRLGLMGQPSPPIVVVPEFYNPNGLSGLLRAGRVPVEREYQGGAANAG